MTLLAVAQRPLLEIACAPYRGKGTGMLALVRAILEHLMCTGLLFLMDAGSYAFDILWDLVQKGGLFIVKVPAHVQFKRVHRFVDGSWLAELTGKKHQS